jgi:hypothetical protein
MARPRYTAAKRAREQKQKERREAKLARKHSRTRPVASDDATSTASPGPVIDKGGPLPEKPTPTSESPTPGVD